MIKILEVSQIDLIGKRFNGYDMIQELNSNKFDIKQAVLTKQSDNKSVVSFMNTNGEYRIMKYFNDLEKELSIKNVLSITSPNLLKLKEYQDADIIHFHQFHNANLSIPFLKKIASEKKVIISLHDPWSFTGHCVYPIGCDKWKTGCTKCPNLEIPFPINDDKCYDMWNLKKNIFENLDVDILVYSDWMLDLIEESPIFNNQKKVHKISFGIDEKKFHKISRKKARSHYSIPDDTFVFFTRTQKGFKGTSYLLKALKKLNVKNKKVLILTCDTPNLLDEVKDKFTIIDLGLIDDSEMLLALNACDVFLMPSTAESFGLMAIEAMACSKPVIVFNNTALPSVTHAPECGYLVKNCDSDDLMEKMKYAIENQSDVLKRGKLARSIVKKEYKLDIYNKRISDLYIKVSKRNKKCKEYKIVVNDNENTNQFKFLLNDLTVMIFGTKHPIVSELLYSVKKVKRIKNYKFSFSDENMQNLIMEYTMKLKELFEKYHFGDLEERKKVEIEKFIYFLKNNPRKIKLIFKKGK